LVWTSETPDATFDSITNGRGMLRLGTCRSGSRFKKRIFNQFAAGHRKRKYTADACLLDSDSDMHIVDGVLSAPVLIGGSMLAVAGVARGLSVLDTDSIPRAGLLTAVFFIASLVHVPIGPSSAHLMLSGLMGLLLGWAAFPAILVGLLLQAAFFGFGGLTAIGANTLNLALPAVVIGLLARHLLVRLDISSRSGAFVLVGFLVGALSFGASGLLVAGVLALSGSEFLVAARLILIVQVPVMLVEGAITAAALRLLLTVRPELLPRAANDRPVPAERPQEA